MAKESSSADSSLPLHEVLEAEFVALHGELPSDDPGSSESKARLKTLYDAIHGLKEKRAALCISGGGIRSATFGLGILQGGGALRPARQVFIILQFIRDVLKRHLEMEAPDWLSGLLAANS